MEHMEHGIYIEATIANYTNYSSTHGPPSDLFRVQRNIIPSQEVSSLFATGMIEKSLHIYDRKVPTV